MGSVHGSINILTSTGHTPMQPTPEDTNKALLKLLSVVAGPSRADVDETKPAVEHITLCIKRTQVETSEGAALIGACAQNGRAMLSRAQQQLEQLQALKVLESVARESFALLKLSRNPEHGALPGYAVSPHFRPSFCIIIAMFFLSDLFSLRSSDSFSS